MYLLPDLNKVSDYLPIIYNGHNKLVAAKLIIITAKFRKLDDLHYCLVLKNDFAKEFPYNFVISYSDFERQKRSFPKVCHCKEYEGGDPVARFAEDNKLNIEITKANQENGKIYFLGTGEEYKNAYKLDKSGILKNAIICDSIVECVNNANIVLGYESIGLVACAYKKKKVVLVSKDNTNSFRMMFPDSNYMK